MGKTGPLVIEIDAEPSLAEREAGEDGKGPGGSREGKQYRQKEQDDTQQRTPEWRNDCITAARCSGEGIHGLSRGKPDQKTKKPAKERKNRESREKISFSFGNLCDFYITKCAGVATEEKYHQTGKTLAKRLYR
jgi:hypothetical protein